MLFFIFLVIRGGDDSWVRHFHASLLIKGTSNGISRMDPTKRVQNIFWKILRVNTINRVSHVLSRRHNQTKCYQHHNRDRVMQAKDGRVNMHMGYLNQVLQATKDIQHIGRSSSALAEDES